jgi:excisionase family DNA binding protein
MNLEELISQSEAARLRNVSKQAIAKLVKSGRLRSIKVGGHTLVYRTDVENFTPRKAGRPRKEKIDENKRSS